MAAIDRSTNHGGCDLRRRGPAIGVPRITTTLNMTQSATYPCDRERICGGRRID